MIDLFSIPGLIYGVIIGFSALIHGTIGIGFPLVATPLLSMFMDVEMAVLILVLPTMILNIANISTGGSWDKSIAVYWPLAVYGIAGSFIGTYLLIALDDNIFRLALAGMLIFYLNAERMGYNFSWIDRYPARSMAIFGLAAGISGGSVNVMLPPLIIYALEKKIPKREMIQTFNFCFLFGKLTQGLVFSIEHRFTIDIFKVSIPLAILGLVIMMMGMQIRDKIETKVYRKWLRRFIMVMSVLLLLKSIPPFFI